MKVMISQPMNGKSNRQIIEERKALTEQLISEGHEIIDTILDISENKSPVYYLGTSIQKMAEADAVVFMKGWKEARGCRIEHLVAKEYGKFIKEEI